MFQALSSSLVGNRRSWHVRGRRRRQRSLVLLPNTEKSDGQLCIGRDSSKDGVSQFDILLPARIRPVEEVHSRCNDGITEEAKTSTEAHALDGHVGGCKIRSKEHRDKNTDEDELGSVAVKRRRWAKSVSKSFPGVDKVSNHMHRGTSLIPDSFGDRLLGPIVLGMRILSARFLSGFRGFFSKLRRVWSSTVIVGVALGIFSSSSANNNLHSVQSLSVMAKYKAKSTSPYTGTYRREACHKAMSLLLHRFALVLLRSTSD